MNTPLTEPLPTAWLLAGLGTLLALSVLVSRLSRRTHIPAVLVFLVIACSPDRGACRCISKTIPHVRLGTRRAREDPVRTAGSTPRGGLSHVSAAACSRRPACDHGMLVAVGARILGFAGRWRCCCALVASTDARRGVLGAAREGRGGAPQHRRPPRESVFNDPSRWCSPSRGPDRRRDAHSSGGAADAIVHSR